MEQPDNQHAKTNYQQTLKVEDEVMQDHGKSLQDNKPEDVLMEDECIKAALEGKPGDLLSNIQPSDTYLSGEAAATLADKIQLTHAKREEPYQDSQTDQKLKAEARSDLTSQQHLNNIAMVEKMANIFNKVIATWSTDRYATPLRIQRDLLYGPEMHPVELEQSIGAAPKRLPPIDWNKEMGFP